MAPAIRSGTAGVLLAMLLVAKGAEAQVVGGGWDEYFRLEGTQAGALFGFSVAAAGDVNNDGVPDFVVGAPSMDVGLWNGAGSVFVYSGRDRALIWRADGPHELACFGFAVAGAGDANHDGHDDILVGAPCADIGTGISEGAVFVYSGLTGLEIQRVVGVNNLDGFGDSVDGGGDVNGDGTPDWLIGAPYTDPRGATCGSAYVFSGAALWPAQPQKLLQVNGYHNTELADSLSFIEDIDLDGRDDFILGAPGANVGGVMNSGSAIVISGGNGSVLFRMDSPLRGFLGRGDSVAGAGDVNGDGLPDFILGAPFAEPHARNVAGAVGAASGRSSQGLWARLGEADATLGWSVAGAGDLDGDGLPDLVASAFGRGYAVLLRGLDGKPIWRLPVDADTGDEGDVAGLGDLNGDGFPEILVGSGSADPNGMVDAGTVYVFERRTLLALSPASVSASIGGSVLLDIDFPATEGGQPYQVYGSRSGLGPTWVGGVQVPLSVDGIFRRTQMGNYPSYSSRFAGHLDAGGDATATLAPAPGQLPATLVGSMVYFAVATGTTAGVWSLSSMAASLQVLP